MKLLISILSILILQTCKTNSIDDTLTIWINSAKTECAGVGKRTCMQIQKSETLDLSKDWELFYSQIEGFDYVTGYLYKLNIKTETIENPPADGSSIKYTLIDVLEKKKDTRYAIHDIYVLTHINGKNIENEVVDKTPTLEINVSKMLISGTNGCNNFGGSISKLDENRIKFGQLRETMMMCADMAIPDTYSKGLANVKTFKKEQNILSLFNAEQKNILTFKKVD